ncbi:cadherin-like beta sandwich domain-containing protein [Lachnospira pectinoschiza]|uniref:Cadherin-like beta sandwich domain-containing protein n=1 Tax=Lachnospira pectinoschiza TaxID=28052 RepID=A0A1G9U3M1_9FIRM|nr:cadherin-like beta sandwich domain-containing protein [Lachnospira pectinoschiza]SDM54630.1 Cadherin-like beta sandwich domain-containing protein [Lachnospira pectinoschiza]
MRKREGYTRLLSTIIAFLLVFVSIFAGQNLKDIKAAQTANISISSASATVGESVTVTLTISASSEVYATQLYLSYDTNILQYVSGSADTSGAGTLGLVNTDTFTSKSFNFTFKIVGVGTSSVSVTGNTRLIDGNEEDMTVSSSKGSVTGKAAANYSSDNTLKSLKISPGVLSPAFSSSTTYYTTSVDADVENLVVNAVANDSNATVSVKYANLDMGANKTYVVVTAQNGDTKTYTIATTRGDTTENESTTEAESQSESETEEIVETEVSIDGIRYKVLNSFEEHPLPEGFTEFVCTDYEGLNLLAGKQESTGLVIMYLENVDGTATSGFFIYDKDSGDFYPYNTVSQPNFNYCILPLSKAGISLTGLELTTGQIEGNEVECYTDADRTFFVFYGIDSNGVEGFYKYLISDGTIQLYDVNSFVASDAADVSKAEAKGMVSKAYKWYFYLSLFCLAVVLLAAIIIISIQSVRLSKLGANKDESEEDEDYGDVDLENADSDTDAEMSPEEEAKNDYETVELIDVDEHTEVAEPTEPTEEIELTEIDKDEK